MSMINLKVLDDDSELIQELQADLKRKDELIASANLLIDQLKVEVATLKQSLIEAQTLITDMAERTVGTYEGMTYTFDEADVKAYKTYLDYCHKHNLKGCFK